MDHREKPYAFIIQRQTNYTYIYKLLKLGIFSLPILEKKDPTRFSVLVSVVFNWVWN